MIEAFMATPLNKKAVQGTAKSKSIILLARFPTLELPRSGLRV